MGRRDTLGVRCLTDDCTLDRLPDRPLGPYLFLGTAPPGQAGGGTMQRGKRILITGALDHLTEQGAAV